MYNQRGQYIQPYMRSSYRGRVVKRTPKRAVRPYGPRASIARNIGIAAPRGGPQEELKFFDLQETLAFAAPGWLPMGGTSFPQGAINYMDQGSTSSTRIGKSINMKSMQLRWQANSTATAVQRILVVCIKNPNLSGTASDTIANFLIGTTPNQTSVLNLQNTDFFEVLLDKYPQRDQQLSLPQSDSYFKKLNHEARYTLPSQQIVKQGAIYVFIYSAGATGSINLTTRIRYTDA